MGLIAAAGIGAAGAVGGSIFSGIMGAKGAKASAQAIERSTDKAIAYSRESRDLARGDLKPFRKLGEQAGRSLADIISGKSGIDELFKGSSLYQFESELGTRNLNRQLSARGAYNSGAGLESLALFDKSLVAEEGNRWWDKLFNTTQLGANAAAGSATTTTNSGNTMADTALRGGVAQAGQIANQYNAIGSIGPAAGNAIQSGANTYANYSLYKPIIDANAQKMRGGGYDPVFNSTDTFQGT